MSDNPSFNQSVDTIPAINQDSRDRVRRKKTPTSAGGGIYQAVVMRILEKMKHGCMVLHLPDGTEKIIGARGAEVSASIRIVSDEAFKRVALFGDIGLGEAYVAGEWETDDLVSVVSWFILNISKSPKLYGGIGSTALVNFLCYYNRVVHLLRPNSVATSRRNIAEHYDLGNSFYQLWLDPTMTYSSGVFSSPEQSLQSAQIKKYDALCQKLKLQEGDSVLEIGCGWGGFASHAVKHYGCNVTAVTISQAQYDFARERFEREGIAHRVDLRLQDYRELEGQFDKIVSIEMMEALGDRYLETYFKKIHSLLSPHGLVALQYITVPDSRHGDLKRGVDWIQKHVFPGSLLLSVGRVNEAINRTGDLFLHGLEDYGSSYARTLALWREAFNAKLDGVRALGFKTDFIRKWNYYLCYCEAAFAMRNISVVQAVYTRPNNFRTL